jgi:pheromone shutdown protein TraB
MLTLVGVGHVFDLKAPIRELIASRRPAVVGLELDSARFAALRQHERRGGAPLMYRLLAFFQARIADEYGGQAGDEMLAAAEAAQDVGARIAFIDMDAAQIFRAMWGGMPVKERVKLAVATVMSLFLSKRRVEAELTKYEDNQGAYLAEFGNEFPHVKRVLIDERDVHMARSLRSLHAQAAPVVAIVGDGHVEGIRRQLADLPLEVVRLKDLRSGSPPPPPAPPGRGQGITFSYDVGGS